MSQTLAALKKKYRDAILDGMARALWLNAYIRFAENFEGDDSKERDEDEYEVPEDQIPPTPDQGEDWDDIAPETPHAAYLAARDLVKLLSDAEGIPTKDVLADLFELAMTIDVGEFQFDEQGVRGDSKDQRLERERKLELAVEFGSGLGNEALGTGGAWGDHHRTRSMSGVFDPAIPRIEVNYDGRELTWEGFADTSHPTSTKAQLRHVRRGRQGARFVEAGDPIREERIGSMVVLTANMNYAKHTYVFAIGYYGHKFLVSADDEGDALDEIAAWCVANAPGLLADERVNNEYETAIEKGKDESDARELAEQDAMSVDAGDGEPHWFESHEVSVMATDPDRDAIYEIAGFNENPARKNPLESESDEMVMQVKDAIDANSPLDPYKPEVFTIDSAEGKAEIKRTSHTPAPTHAVFVRLHPKAAAKTLHNWTVAEYGRPLEGQLLENHVRTLLEHVVSSLNRRWPIPGAIWTTKAWGWGFMALTDEDDQPRDSATFVIGYNVDAARQNPSRTPSSRARATRATKRKRR